MHHLDEVTGFLNEFTLVAVKSRDYWSSIFQDVPDDDTTTSS